MELGKRIKDYRSSLNWNQDELAEKMFVSRQTISNWENEKSYPDIQSLLLLSNLFEISLDQLVKGDVEKMQEIINEQDVKQMKFYGKMMLACLIIMVVAIGPLFLVAGKWAIIPIIMVGAGVLFFATKLNTIQKSNDVSTYKEIVAFVNGKTLDEATKQQEIGKRPYQAIAIAIAAGTIAFIVTLAIMYVSKNYLGL